MRPTCPTENSNCTTVDAREKALELFIRYGGKHHRRIESEMRALGFPTFTRRVFYNRKRRGKTVAGWIERHRWNGRLPGAGSEAPASAAQRFKAWLGSTAPKMQWDARHQQAIYEALDRITTGRNRRLMILMPPRHGKSELVTIRYAAWRLRERPETRVIIGSYNQSLANKFSRSIRRVLSEEDMRTRQNEQGNIRNDRSSDRAKRGRADSADDVGGQQEPNSHDQNINFRELPMFPSVRSINTMAEWETAAGGGVKAVGVGAGITGFGGDLVIIDDPIKSRAHAESQHRRDAAWAWFRDDITTRLEPGAAMILIQTRWHEDDIAGRLLRDMDAGGEHWEVIRLPALSVRNADTPVRTERNADTPVRTERNADTPVRTERNTDTPVRTERNADTPARTERNADTPVRTERNSDTPARTERNSDTPARTERNTDAPARTERNADTPARTDPNAPRLSALWPERFDIGEIERIRQNIGSYSFASLYQQSPSPAEGGIFKRAWFTRIVESAPPALRWYRGYDLAVSRRTTADFTASFRVARGPDGTFYIADGFRGRIGFPAQRRYIIGRMQEERSTSHGVESSVHGTAVVQDIANEHRFPHIPIKDVQVDSDKLTRALAWANHAEAGSIALVRGPWIDDFIEELAAFPNGRNDDQIDAVSIAFRMLGEPMPRKAYAW